MASMVALAHSSHRTAEWPDPSLGTSSVHFDITSPLIAARLICSPPHGRRRREHVFTVQLRSKTDRENIGAVLIELSCTIAETVALITTTVTALATANTRRAVDNNRYSSA